MSPVTSFRKVRDLLAAAVCPVSAERLPLSDCSGRILAEALVAESDVPPFDRSPFDGYVLRASDSAAA